MRKVLGILESLLFETHCEAHIKRVENELHVMSFENFLFWDASVEIDQITRSTMLVSMLNSKTDVG